MKKTYQLNDLDCAVCAQKMQDAISKVEGITNVNVSYIMQKMTIETAESVDPDQLMKKIVKLVKKIEPDCEIVL